MAPKLWTIVRHHTMSPVASSYFQWWHPGDGRQGTLTKGSCDHATFENWWSEAEGGISCFKDKRFRIQPGMTLSHHHPASWFYLFVFGNYPLQGADGNFGEGEELNPTSPMDPNPGMEPTPTKAPGVHNVIQVWPRTIPIKSTIQADPLPCMASDAFGMQSETKQKMRSWNLTEIDEEPAVALALVLGKNHYAGNVVLLLAVLLLVRERERAQTLKARD